MKIVGERMRTLRESVKLPQMKIAKLFGISQSSLARYETDDGSQPLELLMKYADYFDVSMDYMFGRTDDPHGMNFENKPKIVMEDPELARFVEMCFEPGSAMNERLKDTILRMLTEEKK